MQAEKGVGLVIKVPDSQVSDVPSIHKQAPASRSSLACQCALLTNNTLRV